MIILDFETRSHCPLKDRGSYLYAADLTTEVLCLGWYFGDQGGVVERIEDLPGEVVEAIANGGLVAAWNAQFDRLIWERFAPEYMQIPLNRWYCVAAQARVNALPGGLNDCARAVYGKYKKDVRGASLVRAMSIPPYEDTPELRRAMQEYCLQDVLLTRDLMSSMRMMSPTEHQHYIDTEVMNDDGMEVDTFLAADAVRYAEAETEALAERLKLLTVGEITKHTQVQRIKKWLEPRLSDYERKLLTIPPKRKGEPERLALDKPARAQLLEVPSLHPQVREVVEILDEGNKSSVAKFQRMLDRAGPDNRVRGAFVYAGAGQTKRFASRGLQLHNFTRDCFTAKEASDVCATMEAGDPIPDVMGTLSKMLRPALLPSEGNVFVVGDWKGIEACALPWLANDPEAEERLNILRDPGQDIYVVTQERLGLESRQLGKVVELSMGYSGGVGAFKTMAKAYGMDYPEHQIRPRVVDAWRQANPWAVRFWNALETAARRAVSRPGSKHRAGRVAYQFMQNLLGGTLVCTLPNGEYIQYPQCRLEDVETEFGMRTQLTALKSTLKPAAGQPEWPRVSLWRGLLVENVDQAFCAALLRDAVSRAMAEGYSVVGHVHDEMVSEIPRPSGYTDEVTRYKRMMEYVPKYAKGMPLIADVKIMECYGK